MHAGNTLLYDAFDLLEHVGVFFIDPVSKVSTVIQDLTDNPGRRRARLKRKGERLREDVKK